jgi:hypothetical protein
LSVDEERPFSCVCILSSFTLRLTSEDVFGPDEIDNVFDTGGNLSVEDERPFSCDCTLSISQVPWKSSDVSLKVNEDNVQTQNGRSSSTNKFYPVSNELPISSGPRKSSDLSLKSPIDTDSVHDYKRSISKIQIVGRLSAVKAKFFSEISKISEIWC